MHLADREGQGGRVLGQRRRPVRAREVVPRTRDAASVDLELPRRAMLSSGVAGARRTVGGEGLAGGADADESAGCAADRILPGGRLRRGVRVPRVARAAGGLR
ncbi:hypothetical protein PLANTIT3_100162 [Plantibacter sp. T3]|nr:hypothetical protein PLANTIT3_100162 [Plantibacter sp. T3]